MLKQQDVWSGQIFKEYLGENTWEVVKEETEKISNAMDGIEDSTVFGGSNINSSEESNTKGDINEWL